MLRDRSIKQLAILMTLTCVRNTVIEEYHARGSLSQKDMKAFNKEVADKIYTWLYVYYRGSVKDKINLLRLATFSGEPDWDIPELDEGYASALRWLSAGEVKSAFREFKAVQERAVQKDSIPRRHKCGPPSCD